MNNLTLEDLIEMASDASHAAAEEMSILEAENILIKTSIKGVIADHILTHGAVCSTSIERLIDLINNIEGEEEDEK